MGTQRAGVNRRAALTQLAPLPVTIDQGASLVEHPVQQQRRAPLHLPQQSDVDTPTGDPLQAGAQSRAGRMSDVSERYKQIHIRACVLMTTRDGAPAIRR